MRIKNIFFCLAVIGIGVLIKMIPWNQLIPGFATNENRKLIRSVAEVCLILPLVLYLVKRFGFRSEAGMKDYRPGNYWMILLPIIYPGIMNLINFDTSCDLWSVGFLLFCFYRFFAALFEEFVFRGLIQGYLSHQYPAHYHRVNLVSAILFALIHFMNLRHDILPSVLSQVVFAFYMGLMFSAIFRWVRNIWYMGLIHACVNIVMSGYCAHLQPETADNVYTIADCMEAILSAALIMSPMLLIYFLLMYQYKKGAASMKK